MKLLPVALNLADKRCLVVGGGKVAARKVGALLECGAVVRVVAPEIVESLREQLPHYEWLRRLYDVEDSAGCELVFACTSDAAVNRQIVEVARREGIWCNSADGGEGDFHVAAVVRRGEICVGISTGGNSPALSRHLKSAVEEAIGEEYEQLLALMSERRERLKTTVPDQGTRARIWREILAGDVLEKLRAGHAAEAAAMVDAAIAKGEGA